MDPIYYIILFVFLCAGLAATLVVRHILSYSNRTRTYPIAQVRNHTLSSAQYAILSAPVIFTVGWLTSASITRNNTAIVQSFVSSILLTVGLIVLYRKIIARAYYKSADDTCINLIEVSPRPTMLLDLDGCCIRVNRIGLDSFGLAAAETAGRPFAEFWSEEIQNDISLAIQQAGDGNYSCVGAVYVNPQGCTTHWNIDVKPITSNDRSIKRLIVLCTDITDIKSSIARQELNEARLEALLKLHQMSDASVQELADFALEEGVRLTKSQVGYLAFLDQDETALYMHSWSQQAMQECRIQNPEKVYPVAATGLWGDAIRQRMPIITNDYSDPAVPKKGYPEGHIPIMRHMNVPIFDSGKIVAVVGVANKGEDYNDSDVLQLTLIMNGVWRILVQKRSEDALRDSEQRYRLLAENVTDVIWTTDLNLSLTYVTPSVSKLIGYTADELVGRSVNTIITDSSMIAVNNELNKYPYHMQCNINNYPFPASTLELEVMHANGSIVWTETKTTFTLDAEGNVIGILGVTRDITERKEAEAALIENEANYRAIFDAANDAIFIHDAKTGQIVDVNQKMLEMFGLSYEEACRAEVNDTSAVDASTARDDAYLRIREAAQGHPQMFEWEAKDKAGRNFWVEVNLKLAKIGGYDRILAIVRDISERKRAEEELRSTNQSLNALVQASPIAIIALDTEETVRAWNHAAELMFGWDEHEVIGKHYPVVQEDMQGEFQKLKERLLRGESYTDVNAVRHRKDGSPIDISISAAPLYDASGRVNGAMSLMIDITDRKKAEDALRIHTSAINAASDQVIITNTKGIVEFVNPAFERESGYTLLEAIGQDSRFIRSNCHDEGFYADLWNTILSGNTWHNEMINKRKDGSLSTDDVTITPIIGDTGKIEHFIAIKRNITDKKVHQQRMDHLAHHDPLTGLPNRLLFGDRLTQHLAHSRRDGQMLAVMFLDLDRFKLINDTLGHNAGDLLLKEVATRLKVTLREVDTIARMGGDEFTIILADVKSESHAEELAGRIIEVVCKPFFIDGRELFVTASIGISLYPTNGLDAETLVRNADTAMYRAKELGRDTYQLYTESLNTAMLERMTMEHSLRKAIEQDEFVLHYQPRVDLRTGQILGAEALVRWRHPELGLVPPNQFIPLAEETGLIVPIGEKVISAACEQNRAWHNNGLPPISIAVNVSARQFQQQDLVGTVRQILSESGLNPRFLDIELTESTLMQNPELAVEVLSDLKAMGVRISIDDFGTGYSSLSYLKRFPIDTVKIDRSFIRDITTNPDDAAIAGAVVAMAHSLNLSVIAEGVETIEQLEFLRAINCDEIQGYFISHPIPADDFQQMLRLETVSAQSKITAA